MPQEASTADDRPNRAARRAEASNKRRLRPRFVSIREAADYLRISRSKFYADYLSKVKTVRAGRRNLVDLESLDQLADELLAEGGL